MKNFIIVLIVLSIGLIIYNFTVIDFSDPFGGDSIVGVITVMAGLCAILLLAILYTSKKIQEKSRGK